jgi:uncharacterized metal-binding protein
MEKSMNEKSLCEANDILIFSCAGSSNVGQIANQAAIRFAQAGIGRTSWLAGIGGDVSGMVESTKAGKMLVAINGCPVTFVTKMLEHAGFHFEEYIQATDLGIEKNLNLDLDPSDAGKVASHVASLILKRRGL